MQNYYNYFTEIEERFQQRRGSLLLLSTIDWALIESWRDAGIPLEAVLRGIDQAFDKYDARKAGARARRINGLAWCAQGIMEAAEEMREAAVGIAPSAATESGSAASGFEPARIADHLQTCARALRGATVPTGAAPLIAETIARLEELAADLEPQDASRNANGNAAPREMTLEELERTLTVTEEKLHAMLLATASEAELVALREQAARELAPYRSRMQALQIRQIEQQFLQKKLLEKYAVPRISLFYMSQG